MAAASRSEDLPFPPPHTPRTVHCFGDRDFDRKISAISASIKNLNSYISPEYEVVVIREPRSFTITYLFL